MTSIPLPLCTPCSRSCPLPSPPMLMKQWETLGRHQAPFCRLALSDTSKIPTLVTACYKPRLSSSPLILKPSTPVLLERGCLVLASFSHLGKSSHAHLIPLWVCSAFSRFGLLATPHIHPLAGLQATGHCQWGDC